MNDQKLFGGWTVQGIMEMIHTKGVPQYLAQVESLNKQKFPWSACKCEHQIWSKWCEEMVFMVRQRIVQQMVAHQSSLSCAEDDGGDQQDGDSNAALADGDGEPLNAASEEVRSLQKLFAQQTQEVQELRQSLLEAQTKLAFEGTHVACVLLVGLRRPAPAVDTSAGPSFLKKN